MLPSNPLHHLMMRKLGVPVVATSGNLSDEPICTDEHEALERLGGIADLFLVHDRPIVRHVDDSIVRVLMGREMVLRRARGYAPLPVPLPGGLAVERAAAGRRGAPQEHRGGGRGRAGDAQPAPRRPGDRGVVRGLRAGGGGTCSDCSTRRRRGWWRTSIRIMFRRASPSRAGCRCCGSSTTMPTRWPAWPRTGSTSRRWRSCWDGTGLGTDGTIWGGEFLTVNGGGFERFAHLRTFPLPGGDAAAREPRRCAGRRHVGDRRDRAGASDVHRCRVPAAGADARAGDQHHGDLQRGTPDRCGGGVARRARGLELRGPGGDGTGVPRGTSGAPAAELPAVRCRIAGGARMAACRRLGAVAESAGRRAWRAGAAGRIGGVVSRPVWWPARWRSPRWPGGRWSRSAAAASRTGCCWRAASTRLRAAGFRPFWHQRVPPNDGGVALGQAVAGVARQMVTTEIRKSWLVTAEFPA